MGNTSWRRMLKLTIKERVLIQNSAPKMPRNKVSGKCSCVKVKRYQHPYSDLSSQFCPDSDNPTDSQRVGRILKKSYQPALNAEILSNVINPGSIQPLVMEISAPSEKAKFLLWQPLLQQPIYNLLVHTEQIKPFFHKQLFKYLRVTPSFSQLP